MSMDILTVEGSRGSGMMLSSVAIAYRQYLEGSKVVLSLPLTKKGYTCLTREDFLEGLDEYLHF